MKLTTYHKDAIIRAICDDLPKSDDKVTANRLQDAIYKAMSPECKRLYNKNPKALRNWQFYEVFEEHGRTLVVGDADYEAAAAPFAAEKKARSDLRNKVRHAVYGCTTRKQLVDRYPEFSKYAPSEHGVCTTLPVPANVIADLVKAGWKQTVFKEAAK